MKEQQWLEDGWFYHNHAWHLLHEFLKLIREVDAESLLDVGAGTGLAAAVIRAVFPEIEIDVTDIEKECAEFWEKRDLCYWKDINDCKFMYDIVMSSHVLEHVPEPCINHDDPAGDFIRNIFKAAKKRLIIAVPDGDVHFYDHKVIYDRAKLESTIRQALEGEKFTYKGFPVYHAHMNNLVAVVDKV